MFLLSLTATCQGWTVSLKAGLDTYNGMQELVHRLELHVGFAPQRHTGPRRHLTPTATQSRQGALLAAHGRQALAHGADAGGGDGPSTGVEATVDHRPRLLFRRSSASGAGVA